MNWRYYIYIYNYIYTTIYICVYVCMCVCVYVCIWYQQCMFAEYLTLALFFVVCITIDLWMMIITNWLWTWMNYHSSLPIHIMVHWLDSSIISDTPNWRRCWGWKGDRRCGWAYVHAGQRAPWKEAGSPPGGAKDCCGVLGMHPFDQLLMQFKNIWIWSS